MPATPELLEIAERCWWRGPPEEILQNPPRFIHALLNACRYADEAYCAKHLPREVWLEGLRTARPGQVPKRGFAWWGRRFGLEDVEERLESWPDRAHRWDIPWREGADRSWMFETQRRLSIARWGKKPATQEERITGGKPDAKGEG